MLPLAVAAVAALGPWAPPQDVEATAATEFSGAAVAVSAAPRGGVAVLTVRRRGAQTEVVLRRAGASTRLGAPVVLARNPRSTLRTALDLRPDGTATAAWIAYSPTTRNQRLVSTRLAPGARAGTTRALTGAGSSAYDAAFVPGLGGPTLTWTRRTGAPQAARFPDAAPFRLGLPVDGVAFLAYAGTRTGRVLVAGGDATRVRVAVGHDGTAFGRTVTVPGSTGAYAPPAVGMDSAGNGALAWAEPGATGTDVLAAVVPAGSASPQAAVHVASPTGAPSAPVLAPREGGGAFVGWVETVRERRVSSSAPGPAHVRTVSPAGRPSPRVTLGGRGEQVRRLLLASRGGRGAMAVWVTESGALRTQDIEQDGRLGRARTLDRGVDPYGLRLAGRGRAAVTYRRGDRVRLVLRRSGS